jgi:uncharacterized lipoprotein YddW (UPF0748 family)
MELVVVAGDSAWEYWSAYHKYDCMLIEEMRLEEKARIQEEMCQKEDPLAEAKAIKAEEERCLEVAAWVEEEKRRVEEAKIVEEARVAPKEDSQLLLLGPHADERHMQQYFVLVATWPLARKVLQLFLSAWE